MNRLFVFPTLSASSTRVCRTLTKSRPIRFASGLSASGILLSSSGYIAPEGIEINENGFNYDLIVIGGGSGGLACAKEAADLGKRVALFDYVKPSAMGTTWKLGGTCVNVGCIPKKLMHYTALVGDSFHDAREMGWKIQEHPEHDWEQMMRTINTYISKLQYGYRVQLEEKNITYYRALASFLDDHTLGMTVGKRGAQWKKGDKREVKITGENIVIATGGRPHVLDIPGKELAITSDDIFWMRKSPGKTLVIGASYISLETAGFLNEFGYETHVMVRSILLRGFDRQCADMIGEYMENQGVVFKNKSTPDALEKTTEGRIKVTYSQKDEEGNVQTLTEIYDTVMFATGRDADTSCLQLENAGVKTAKNGKFDTVQEQTNVPHIFAIGDVCNGKQELTPVAIQAGTLLSRRLFTNSSVQMDYDNVATTVFTPLEYGTTGLSEEDAIERYGEQNIESFLTKFTALEHSATHRVDRSGNEIIAPHFAKLVVHTGEFDRVVGFHYLGPNAGEVTQGYALAIKLGATKADFDNVVGIHPTTAEKFTTLHITKSSGKEIQASSC